MELQSEKNVIAKRLKGIKAKYFEEIKEELREVVPNMDEYKEMALEYADNLSGVSELLDEIIKADNPLKHKEFNTVARYMF